MKDYKLPLVVDISITLKLLESKGTTENNKFYGFRKLGGSNANQLLPSNSGGSSSANAQRQGDANISQNSMNMETTENPKNKNTKSFNNRQANTQKTGNKKSIKTKAPTRP
jgi:hypothetical protein